MKDSVKAADTGLPGGDFGSYSVDLVVSLSLLSLRLVSVHAAQSGSLGQPHPLDWERNVNIELPAAPRMTFADRFDAAQAEDLLRFCPPGREGEGGSERGRRRRRRPTGGMDQGLHQPELQALGGRDPLRPRRVRGLRHVHVHCACAVPYSRLGPVAPFP